MAKKNNQVEIEVSRIFKDFLDRFDKSLCSILQQRFETLANKSRVYWWREYVYNPLMKIKENLSDRPLTAKWLEKIPQGAPGGMLKLERNALYTVLLANIHALGSDSNTIEEFQKKYYNAIYPIRNEISHLRVGETIQLPKVVKFLESLKLILELLHQDYTDSYSFIIEEFRDLYSLCTIITDPDLLKQQDNSHTIQGVLKKIVGREQDRLNTLLQDTPSLASSSSQTLFLGHTQDEVEIHEKKLLDTLSIILQEEDIFDKNINDKDKVASTSEVAIDKYTNKALFLIRSYNVVHPRKRLWFVRSALVALFVTLFGGTTLYTLRSKTPSYSTVSVKTLPASIKDLNPGQQLQGVIKDTRSNETSSLTYKILRVIDGRDQDSVEYEFVVGLSVFSITTVSALEQSVSDAGNVELHLNLPSAMHTDYGTFIRVAKNEQGGLLMMNAPTSPKEFLIKE